MDTPRHSQKSESELCFKTDAARWCDFPEVFDLRRIKRLNLQSNNEVAVMIKRVSSMAAIALTLILGGLAIYARDMIACSLVRYSDFVQIGENVYVAPGTSEEYRKQLLSLIEEAKSRVVSTYGHLESSPVIIAAMGMDSLRGFSSTEYATTHFLPGQSFIVIGPKGHNTDIISHELVHSGTFEQIGYWARTFHMPVWFEEGVAMQVDYREQYDLLVEKDHSPRLDSLWYRWQFFHGDDAELTNHYAIAKAEVKRWFNKVGDGGVQSLLKKVKSGADFDETYRKMRDNKG